MQPFEVTFHLKHGHAITVTAIDLSTRHSTLSGEFTEYKVTYPDDYSGTRIHAMPLENIVAITKSGATSDPS